MGRTFLGVNLLQIIHLAVFRDVCGDFLRFRQRADPPIVVGLLRGWALFSFPKHELRIEQESTFFW